ncbi:MAG: ATP synthase F1 subunit epsilon, partial [Opitutaceae bacterium]
VTQVDAGELRATKGGVTQLLVVGGGFAQVTGEKVSILANSAISEEKIDADAAENAMKRAQEALSGTQTLDAAEVERLEGLVRFAVAQLGVAARRRK